MTMPHLTFDNARALAHTIIIEYGSDHRYKAPGSSGACMYTEDNGDSLCPSCFVGVLLDRFGVSLTDLKFIDQHKGNGAACLFTHNLHHLNITVEEQAASFLTRFQQLQDDETPWGECMTDAVMTASGDPEWIRTAHGNECPYQLGEVIE